MGVTYKIHTNSGNVTFRVSIISKTQQQTRFAHAGITDQQQLKQEITKQRFETGTIESWYHLLLSIHLNKSTASNRDETFRILTNDKRGIKSTSPSQKYIHGDRTIPIQQIFVSTIFSKQYKAQLMNVLLRILPLEESTLLGHTDRKMIQ